MNEELVEPTLKEVWGRLFKRELFYKFDENDTVVEGGVATIFRKELNRVF